MPYTKQNFVDGQTLTAPQLNTMEAGIQTADAEYVKQNFVNGQTLTAAQLNHMEDGIVSANNKPAAKPEESKSVKYTTNGTRTITPSAGSTMSSVRVEVAVPSSGSAKPEETKDVTYTSNGTYNVSPTSGKVLSGVKVTVSVPSSGGGGGSLPDVIQPGDKVWEGSFASTEVTDTAKPTNCTMPISVPKAGKWRVRVFAHSSGGVGAQSHPTVFLYKNGASAKSVQITAAASKASTVIDIDLAKGDAIAIYGQAAGSSWSQADLIVQGMVLCYMA